MTKSFSNLTTFHAFRHYIDFRYLWTGYSLYNITWRIEMIAFGWLVYEMTNSALLVGLFTAVRLFPTLLAPFAGTIADKISRRRFLIILQFIQIVYASITAILIYAELLQFWHLMIIGLLAGTVFSAVYPTVYAYSMDIVGKDNVSNAVALISVALFLSAIVGPAIGGPIADSFGPASPFLLITVISLLSVISYSRVRAPSITAQIAKTALNNLTDGFKHVIHSRGMLSVFAISFASNLLVWPEFQAFIPIFAKDNLGQSASGLGFIHTAMGIGAVIASLIFASLGDYKRKGLMYLLGTGWLAVFFGWFAITRSYPLALVLIGLFGACSVAFNNGQTALTLILSPEEMRGRSMGFLSMAIGIYAPGSLLMGGIANYIGASLTTAICCGVMVVVIIIALIVLPNLRRLD